MTKTVITKEELIEVINTNFNVERIKLLLKDCPETIYHETIKYQNKSVDLYTDSSSNVTLLFKESDFIERLFKDKHIVIAIKTKAEVLLERGNLCIINSVGTAVGVKGNSVVCDTRFKRLHLGGNNSVNFSRIKGDTTFVDSDIFATVINTEEATIRDCEVKFSQFNGESVRFVNQVIHDTTLNDDRSKLISYLMSVTAN